MTPDQHEATTNWLRHLITNPPSLDPGISGAASKCLKYLPPPEEAAQEPTGFAEEF